MPRIRNNVGSSSGAGSGVFHQYRLGRRKEEERLKAMAEENAKEKADRYDSHDYYYSDNGHNKARREWEEQRLARIAEEERKRTKVVLYTLRVPHSHINRKQRRGISGNAREVIRAARRRTALRKTNQRRRGVRSKAPSALPR